MSSDLKLSRCSLDRIIRDQIHKYAGIFVSKKLTLTYESISQDVLTDEKWLVFVLEQILSNALKYTKSGSIHIYLSPDAPKTLVIEDTGIGIAPEDLPRIFEKGFTGYNGRAGQKSTGLGLYLCKRAARQISARITASSVVGEGSVFSVDLNLPELQVE